jgi:hypothetical protein
MKTKEEFCIIPPNLTDYNYRTERVSNLQRHEIFFGNRNRQKSIDDGLIVFLTEEQHKGTNGVHGKNGHEYDLYLKKIGQKAWMSYYKKTKEDFIKKYGRNYL